jgi:hypothetical protein
MKGMYSIKGKEGICQVIKIYAKGASSVPLSEPPLNKTTHTRMIRFEPPQAD